VAAKKKFKCIATNWEEWVFSMWCGMNISLKKEIKLNKVKFVEKKV
jgi:hypothetical protein